MLEDLKPPKRSFPCKIRDTAATLDERDAKILFAAVEDVSWSVIGLSRELCARGLQISEQPIRSHRAKACACFRAR